VHADQPGNGQQRLTGYPGAEQFRRHRPGFQLLPPAPKVLADVAVEPTRRPRVGGKSRQRGRRIGAGQVDAVVAEKDPEPVRGVAVAGQIRGGRRGDLHTPASIRVPCRKLPPEHPRVRQVDRQQVDVR
jgi:hypothetical protein